ncbi:DUF2924 domain-containing protein [Microvirga sp. 2YAF29]|uniref:DUF2924 domain-containing protein n=1 Tax=Microvirga sp. 2YAF29 TaxID=3233031 RepID=UPI003F976221
MAVSDKTRDALALESARIATMELDELKVKFLVLRGVPLPKFMRLALARKAVIHATEEKILGGLDRAARKQLDQLVAQIVPNGQAPPPKPNRKLRSGTRLVREWQGRVHEVAVVKEGYVWQGVCYRSLSEIAHRITGTRWNGWVFFGLKKSGIKTKDKFSQHRKKKGHADAPEVNHV